MTGKFGFVAVLMLMATAGVAQTLWSEQTITPNPTRTTMSVDRVVIRGGTLQRATFEEQGLWQRSRSAHAVQVVKNGRRRAVHR